MPWETKRFWVLFHKLLITARFLTAMQFFNTLHFICLCQLVFPCETGVFVRSFLKLFNVVPVVPFFYGHTHVVQLCHQEALPLNILKNVLRLQMNL